MRKRRSFFFQKSGGVIIAVTGLILIARALPLYLWSLSIGLLLVWVGWHLYAVNY